MSVLADSFLQDEASLRRRLRVTDIHRPSGAAPVTSARAQYLPRGNGLGLRMSIGSASAGAISLYYLANDYAAEISVDDETDASYCVSLACRGNLRIRLPESGSTFTGSQATGLISHNRPGLKLQTSDRNARLNLWIKAEALSSALGSLLDDDIEVPVVFQPAFEWGSEAGCSIRHLIELCCSEIGAPGGLLSRMASRSRIEELVALALLQGLAHNHTGSLAAERHAPAPRQLRRAEAFIRAHAAEDLSLGRIAAAAGCSIRALQIAFRQWRDTTPMAALRDLRLEAVRDALRTGGDEPVAEIARAHGFAHQGRFATSYRRRFGEYPSETLRGRRIG